MVDIFIFNVNHLFKIVDTWLTGWLTGFYYKNQHVEINVIYVNKQYTIKIYVYIIYSIGGNIGGNIGIYSVYAVKGQTDG